MRWRGVAAVVGLTVSVAVAVPDAHGQARVRLTGLIENNVGMERVRVGTKTFETLTWGSRYTPNLDGFLWSPRFVTYSLGGAYASQDTSTPAGQLSFLQRDPYRLQLTFFPQATHSFTLGISQTVTDTTFDTSSGAMPTRTTIERQGFTWTYRGSPALPETTLDLKRQSTGNETAANVVDETRTTISLRAHKSFDRYQPSVLYTVETIDRDSTQSLGLNEAGGVSHQLQYDDRIRLGDRAFLTPTVQYRNAPEIRSGHAGLTLSGPLSATLDGTTGVRYAVQESTGSPIQSVTTDGVLTKRLSSTATLTGGVTGSVVEGKTGAWSAGAFSGLSAQPLPHLRNAADYGLQFTGGSDRPMSTHQRAHLGAVSTFVPRHTITADYYGNVFDSGGKQPTFLSHNATTSITSTLIPLTTVSGRYTADVQDGTGQTRAQRASLGVFFMPVAVLTVRAGGDADTRSTSGGRRAPTKETGLAVNAGIDASLLSWLTLSLSGRRGTRDVEREDKTGTFISEGARGTVSVTFSKFQMHTEAFVDREPIADQQRVGVRGSIAYRFRVWSVALEFERSTFKVTTVDTERERFSFRLSRPLSFSWPFR